MRIVPENFAFQRYVEAKLRVDNPEEAERMRDLTPMVMMEAHFFPSTDNSRPTGCGTFSRNTSTRACSQSRSPHLTKSITPSDVEELIHQDLLQEAWAEISATDEVKRNLERLQPVIERVGY
jgi:hypothetical protein